MEIKRNKIKDGLVKKIKEGFWNFKTLKYIKFAHP